MKLKFKKQTWQVQGRKALRDSFRDTDGDGVINMFDCAPHNFRLQGPQHKLTQEQINYNKSIEEDAQKQASINITNISKKWKDEEIHKNLIKMKGGKL